MRKILLAVATLMLAGGLWAQNQKPAGIQPPALWLQKFAIATRMQSDAQKMQEQANNLFRELQSEMAKPSKDCPKGCQLNQAEMTWVPIVEAVKGE